MNAEHPHQRSNYFIDKTFQSKFIFKFSVIFIICMITVLAIVYKLALENTSVGIINSRVMVQSTADYLLPIMGQTVLIVLVMGVIVLATVLMYISHRIAGPLFRYQADLNKMAEGDFSLDVKTRKKDQLHKLQDAFNGMIQSNRTRIAALKRATEKLDQETGDPKKTQEIKNILNQFKI